MKKVVVTLMVQDDKEKQRAMKKVSSLAGVESIAVDMKEKKLTVIGDIDPVSVVSKLKKLYNPKIVSVGPAKEEKKEPAAKKEEQGKGGGDKGNNNDKKDPTTVPKAINAVPFPMYNYPHPVMPMPYQYQYQQQQQQQQPVYHPQPHNYFVRSIDEDPNACVIC